MNRHQFRTLRNAFYRDKNKSYYTDLKKFELPFLRRKITEIKIGGKKINYEKNVCFLYRLTKGDYTYDFFSEVYHGYRDKDAIYQWKSVEDFSCADMSMIEERRKNWNQPWYKNLHSEYQEEMFAKHKLYFIDKRFITQEQADELASKLFYHT